MVHVISHIDTLLSYSESAITESIPQTPTDFWNGSSVLFAELLALLNKRNGFFGLKKSLHVFPTHPSTHGSSGYDLIEWNSRGLWKNAYSKEVQSILCFAEDIFGCQWALRNDHICKFDPETGEVKWFAHNFESWAEQILQNTDIETGWPLSQQWIQKHGALPAHCRLNPKTLFILGGNFTLENLFAVDAAEGMRFRGDIARQLRDLPEGTQIMIVPRE